MQVVTISFLLAFAACSLEAESLKLGLEKYVGQDLQKFDDRQLIAFADDFKQLTGDSLKLTGRELKLWWVKRFQSDSTTWILLAVYPGYSIPDVSFVEAQI